GPTGAMDPRYYTDPHAGAAGSYAQMDRFTFGGAPLVPICHVGADTSMCKLINQRVPERMPTWAQGWTYYRLETETGSHLRFFWAPNHQTWVIQSPDGTTTELGVPQDDTGDVGGIDTVTLHNLPTSV